MGKIIRRTVTITITESWTITWIEDAQADNEPPRQAKTMAPDQSNIQEESDAAFHTTITAGEPSAGDPTATPLTPAAAPDAPPDDVRTKPSASNRRKHTRRRRSEGI